MSTLQNESSFFHHIAPLVVSLVQDNDKEMTVVENKGLGDYATHMDVATENLIVAELNKWFPNDLILAEEGHSNTSITDGRIWFIDPICGTNNLGKGISNFCTNIALVENSQVIAACVVDHSQGKYYWSVGNGNVFINNQAITFPSPELGIKIDIDFGSVRSVNEEIRSKHNACLLKLINDTDYDVVSLNTSLGFTYTATGKIDGFINVFNYPWDITAASFLVQQIGGVLTGIDGSPWTIASVGAIGGRTPEIHKELLDMFTNS